MTRARLLPAVLLALALSPPLARADTTEPPVFTPGTGTVATGTVVTVTSATPGATVHCAFDGDLPTGASAVTDRFMVLASLVASCIAQATGYLDSPVSTATFIVAGTYYAGARLSYLRPIGSGGSGSTLNPLDSAMLDSGAALAE
jgi:hypothetical protein